jgi:cell division protein FtsA
MLQQDIVVATDIGTRKVVVLVAQCFPGKPPQIIGKGEQSIPVKAMLRGKVEDARIVNEVLHAALDTAEREAEKRVNGIKLLSTYLSLTGGGLVGRRCSGNATVQAANGLVNAHVIRLAEDEARNINFGGDFSPVVRIRQPFFLDGRMCSSPTGQMGKNLRASFWTIGAPTKQIGALGQIVSGANLNISEFIVSSAASGSVLAGGDERENGILVVDIGAGTTDYVLYRKGSVLATGVLPVGGDHITNDLFIGLRVQSWEIAEKIKRNHDPSVLREDEAATVATHGDNAIGDKQIRVLYIERIIRARLSETFDIIKKRLSPNVTREKLLSGVILTGGSSQLKGIDRIAAQVFGLPIRPGELAAWVPGELAFPAYSTVLGVLYEGWSQANKRFLPPLPAEKAKSKPRVKRRSAWRAFLDFLSW